MSETEQELDEEVASGILARQDTEREPERDDADAQTPQEAAADDGSDALIKKAEKAQTNYAKRIRDIFGDNAPQYDCPACNGLGLVWNTEEAQPELVHPDHLVTCDACNGYGSVITGSKAPGRETTVCTACSGNGYITKPAPPAPVAEFSPAPAPVPTTTMGFMGPDGVFVPLGQPQSA
jgi:hypothetical protein